jgi:hypothetical protein
MKRQRRPWWCRCERRLDDPCSDVRERCCNVRQAKGTYLQQENSLAVGLRPRGAAGVLFRLPCGGRGVVWGPLVGAGPFLQLSSEEGILSVGLAPERKVVKIVEI